MLKDQLPIRVNLELDATKLITMWYEDTFKQGIINFGNALGLATELCLLPLRMKVEKARINFKRNLDDYIQKIDTLDEKDICEVPTELAIPILEKLTYVTDANIKELYVNLLLGASQKHLVDMAHPSAIRIVDSLSPDEAKILMHVKDHKDIPFIRLYLVSDKEKGKVLYIKYLTGVECHVDLSFPDNMELYLDNFLACGLYQFEPHARLLNDDKYDPIEHLYADQIQELITELHKTNPERTIKTVRGYLRKSIIGERFIKSCCGLH